MLPHRINDKISWMEQRLDLWTNNADALGLSTEQLNELTSRTAAARNHFNAAGDARATAKSATTTMHQSLDSFEETVREAIKFIKAQASTDPEVYALANIPEPKQPSPVPPPGMPENVITDLDNEGNVILRWTAVNAPGSTGTAFRIYRKLEDQSTYTLIATTGAKTWTDESVPRGTGQVSYQIQALRGTLTSPASEAVTMYFGKLPESGGDELNLAA